MNLKTRLAWQTKLILMLMCAVTLSNCTKLQKSPTNAYGWTDDQNQRAKLSDYKGKVVVLDFYATWCEPCRDETPHLVKMQRQFGGKGLQIIGLNVGGEDDHSQVPNYASEFDIQYPLAIP